MSRHALSRLPFSALLTGIVLAFSLSGCLSGSGDESSDTQAPDASLSPSGDSTDSINSTKSTNSAESTESTDGTDSTDSTAPVSLNGDAGDRKITVSWDTLAEATGYRLYHAAEPGMDTDNYGAFKEGQLLENVSSPLTLNDLPNHRYRFIQVTAMVDGTEVLLGEELALAPRGLQAGAREVRMLELMNRARRDPLAEASRLELDLNEGIDPNQPLSPDPRPPLAFNNDLMIASLAHSQWMLDANRFSHTGENGSSVAERIDASDYPLSAPWGVGENLAWRGTTAPTLNLTTVIDFHHDGLFESPGHRVNILGNFRELGVGQLKGHFESDGTQFLASMLTTKLAHASDRVFLTGVVYGDSGANPLYTVGSGRDDVMIKVDGYYYQPTESGAFAIALAPGSYRVDVTLPESSQTLSHSFAMDSENVKMDIVFSDSHSADLQTW